MPEPVLQSATIGSSRNLIDDAGSLGSQLFNQELSTCSSCVTPSLCVCGRPRRGRALPPVSGCHHLGSGLPTSFRLSFITILLFPNYYHFSSPAHPELSLPPLAFLASDLLGNVCFLSFAPSGPTLHQLYLTNFPELRGMPRTMKSAGILIATPTHTLHSWPRD